MLYLLYSNEVKRLQYFKQLISNELNQMYIIRANKAKAAGIGKWIIYKIFVSDFSVKGLNSTAVDHQ